MKKGKQITWTQAEERASLSHPVIAHRHGDYPMVVTRVENCRTLKDTLYIRIEKSNALATTCKIITEFFEPIKKINKAAVT